MKPPPTKKWNKAVDELTKREDRLTVLIASTNNLELMDAFTNWTEQRNICNELWMKWIEDLTNKQTP